jgi:hypothetical protein
MSKQITHLQFLSIHSRCNLTKNEIRMAWIWIEEWHFLEKIKKPLPFLYQSLFHFLVEIADSY